MGRIGRRLTSILCYTYYLILYFQKEYNSVRLLFDAVRAPEEDNDELRGDPIVVGVFAGHGSAREVQFFHQKCAINKSCICGRKRDKTDLKSKPKENTDSETWKRKRNPRKRESYKKVSNKSIRPDVCLAFGTILKETGWQLLCKLLMILKLSTIREDASFYACSIRLLLSWHLLYYHESNHNYVFLKIRFFSYWHTWA